ncbi:DNA-binding transcriptional regulator, LysR family [Enhydrobacter aerosaccus]|uniref:DNA-binding transcriptional regulator, LysR family n=1 Tax=Enhydrobacter aerosaccus TaxID=225324 RepID=A0A1T4TI29_9HYPH|nr:LysR family transcriptional regulator [Enhydrobacter aerosaccus]SKA39911.1 DNA-binding transcriptional regulator, LysR family [Enhydrobacter aerosaccus]
MELRQLEHFLAVADEKHFTRAAKRVNIVQSGLSASIRSLEQELRADLLIRSTRRVELTMVGRVFYEQAKRILSAAKDARDAVAAAQSLNVGKLSIGTVQSLGPFIDLPVLLERFHARHPNIEIQLCQGGSASLLEKIRVGELDLAFAPVLDPPRGIETTLIACEEMVLACPRGHRLAGHSKISLLDLKDEPFIDFQLGWGTRLIIDSAFAEARIGRRMAFEVADLGTLLDLVARGLGVALVPEPVALARTKIEGGLGIATAQLTRPEICWELVLAFSSRNGGRQPGNPAGRAFVDLLKEIRPMS